MKMYQEAMCRKLPKYIKIQTSESWGGVDFSYVYIEAIKINIISPWFPL